MRQSLSLDRAWYLLISCGTYLNSTEKHNNEDMTCELTEREKESVRYALTEYMHFLKGRELREPARYYYKEQLNHLKETKDKFEDSSITVSTSGQ